MISPYLFLELDDLVDSVVHKFPLGNHKLLPLCRSLVEEAGIHLTGRDKQTKQSQMCGLVGASLRLPLLVLQRDIAGQDVSVFCSFLHVWMSCTVVKHNAFYQPGGSDNTTKTNGDMTAILKKVIAYEQPLPAIDQPRLLAVPSILPGLCVCSVHHLHDLYHVQVNGLLWSFPHCQNGIHHDLGEETSTSGGGARTHTHNTHNTHLCQDLCYLLVHFSTE